MTNCGQWWPPHSDPVRRRLTTAVLASSGAQKRIERESGLYGGNKQWEGFGKVETAHCTTFDVLLDEMGVTHVDYFSLDVEGAEMFILKSILWDKIQIDVFTIEIQEHHSEIALFMKEHGYRRVEPSPLKFDDVFILEKTRSSHKDQVAAVDRDGSSTPRLLSGAQRPSSRPDPPSLRRPWIPLTN